MPFSLYVPTHLRVCQGSGYLCHQLVADRSYSCCICPIWVVNFITVLTLFKTSPSICNEYSKALSTVSTVGERQHCSSGGIFNYCHLTIHDQKITRKDHNANYSQIKVCQNVLARLGVERGRSNKGIKQTPFLQLLKMSTLLLKLMDICVQKSLWYADSITHPFQSSYNFQFILLRKWFMQEGPNFDCVPLSVSQ